MRLLFAEDDKQLRASVTRGLKEALYAVDVAATGPQALSMASADTYDAVILDVLLPGKTGFAVCRAMRARGNQVPVLMLTALDAVERRIEGLDAGADDYLVKPFDFNELLARLRALTRRRGDLASPVFTVGDLVVDPSRRSARRGRREIPLTPTEFAFLAHLARNAGRIVGREELMKHVWNDSEERYSNIIDVYASRIRRKIDDGEKTTLFVTVRGTGFMLDNAAAGAKRAGAGGTRSRS